MAIREGRWDCIRCGTKGIFGRSKVCPNCQSPRPEGVKFYLPEDAQEVTDAEQLKQAQAGADWICAFCGASNEAGRAICKQCNAPREAESTQQQVKDYALGATPTWGDNSDDPSPSPLPPKSKKTRNLLIGAIAFVFSLCVGFCSLFMITKEVTATITGFSWERTIAVEAYRTVTESGWSVPAGGRKISERQEKYDTRRIKTGTETYSCGQRDLGNGHFQEKRCTRDTYREEPIYKTKYIYEIERWVTDHTERATGKDHKPYWPRVSLASQKQREGGRTETYTVYFKDEKQKTYKLNPSLSDWQTYEIGEKRKIKVNMLGDATGIVK
jgi:hypothetical protein